MSAPSDDRHPLFGTTWVHVFEDDTHDGEIYRPADHDLPRTRRPRERLALAADGTARFWAAGPDDRLLERMASWIDVNGTLVVSAQGGGAELHIVAHSAARLVIRARS